MPRWSKIAIAVLAIAVVAGYGVSVYRLHHLNCPPRAELAHDLEVAHGSRAVKVEQCFAHYSMNPPIGSTPVPPQS